MYNFDKFVQIAEKYKINFSVIFSKRGDGTEVMCVAMKKENLTDATTNEIQEAFEGKLYPKIQSTSDMIVLRFQELTSVEWLVDLQLELCKRNNKPLYIPLNGVCYECGKQIFGFDGITSLVAGSKHITKCPHCNFSFVKREI